MGPAAQLSPPLIDCTEDATEDDDHALQPSGQQKKKLRFVQLYTSKSFESRRSELVNPPEANPMRRSSSTEDLQKHVLSPRLVDAISQTAQVVWANTKKREGLTGRSDIRLQTAVGMPVAMDKDGNMCVVVMFSPNSIQSSDDAMEYLQSISRSATSNSIPCLLPVFEPGSNGIMQLPFHHDHHYISPSNALGEGVTARFVSLDEPHGGSDDSSEPEVHSDHELSNAPKDTFGIPMLPAFAELGNVTPTEDNIDVFDEASYGIWTTIMETLNESVTEMSSVPQFDPSVTKNEPDAAEELKLDIPLDKPNMATCRKERLEEFCSAFLGMSVFDVADVWVPAGSQYSDCLQHVMSVTSTDSNMILNEFKRESENSLIKCWAGAVGRAYASGNPVWSANPSVFVDPGRAESFANSKIATVLAVPIFPAREAIPACVVACYSLVKSGSVPFVLRFVQQALRMLWDGLDKVEPHESVGPIWKEVAPADLGEMAADVEMQHHFITKKRPHSMVAESDRRSLKNDELQADYLSSQLGSVVLPDNDANEANGASNPSLSGLAEIKLETVQSYIADAVRSVGSAIPYDHVATNAQGTKRAHIMGPISGASHSPLPLPQGFPSHIVRPPSQNAASPAPIQPTVVNASSFPHTLPQGCTIVPLQSLPAPVNGTSSSIPLIPFCVPASQSVDQSGSLDSKMCRIDGCDEPAILRRPYCTKHSGNRLCEQEGCSKCAQGSTRFCIAHGGGRRCTFQGCDKGARDKFFCAAHGGGKRCKHDGCSKSAVGGSSLCTAHGGGRRCSVPGCDKSAQSSTKFCVKHGGGKKCAREGCEKVARGRTMYCAAHGGGVRCKLDGCNRVAIGKMQLCRAHGGGAREKKNSHHNPIPQQPMISQPHNGLFMNGVVAGMTGDHLMNV